MAIQYEKLLALEFPEREFSYNERDTMLYALGVGLGRVMPDEMHFVYEHGLQALPTLATVIAWDDSWQDATGMDITKIVHGEQRVTLHRPMATAGRVLSKLKVLDVFDKGPGRGAVLLAQTDLRDANSGASIATLLSTVFARGDGGFGGPSGRGPVPHNLPHRPSDHIVQMVTNPDQALIYRLSGDLNPLHVDPDFARGVGFDKPILHGLCSYGIAAASVIKAACDNQSHRVTHFEARFTAPVYPGETLLTEVWIDSNEVSFRTRVAERHAIVLDHGRAVLAPV